MKSLATATYNERLFEGGGFRGFLHGGRFRWFVSRLERLGVQPESICELGCFDGKLIKYLPTPPRRYVGFDANWEGGLDLAAEMWRGHAGYTFHDCRTPDDMVLAAGERFDVSVVMETLEHVPPEMVGGYLERLARHTTKYVFITVPNEKGPLFLAKWLAKRLLVGDSEQYTVAEICNATLGRTHKVARRDHKGFDYDCLADEVARYFDIVEISGNPIGFLPPSLSFGVGIIGRPK